MILAAPPDAPASPQPEVGRAVHFAVSPPLRDLPARPPSQTVKSYDGPLNPPRPRVHNEQPGGVTPDAAISAPSGGPTMPPPLLSFDGVVSQNNFNEYGFRLSPPDTDGDVGPNHYVQAVNILMRIFDKSGTPLTAPFRMSDLYAGLPPTSRCATRDDGDPITLYDSFADRWLISQFSFSGVTGGGLPIAPFFQCIAISVTGDPTGAYYAYEFLMPNLNFNDYPKLGVWHDGYYMTTNQFLAPGFSFNGAGAFAFDRTKMLAGDPSASFIYFNLSLASNPEGIFGMQPSDADGFMPPPAGSPNVFAYYISTEFDVPPFNIDAIRFFDFHADFAVPGNSTFTQRPGSPLPVAAFDPRHPGGRADIEQPPPGIAVDSLSDVLMFRLQYRNFGTHESWVVNHTVNVGTGTTLATHQGAVRYYEFRRVGGAASAITVHEQATHNPDTDNRWMGSSALDGNGNMAVGYSVSSTTTFPSVRYAGRLAADPPGGLAQAETSMVAGTGVQTNTGSRWGDYSKMSVDPVDDCTFWYTQEYYTAASQATSSVGWLTRIGSFKFPSCTPAPTGAVEVNVTDCDTALNLAGANVFVGAFFRTSDGSGEASITNMAPGTYPVSVSRPGYLPATGMATVVAGNTTVVNICLEPIVVLEQGDGTLTAESCSPPNGAPDPGETVTVSLCVTNNGGTATDDLIGTLQSGGGVSNPSGPQDYGDVAPGATVCRDFTFVVSENCGGTIEASVDFEDDIALPTTDYGTFTYEFQVGTLVTALTQNFDGVTAPALPAGWTTANSGGGVPWVTSTTTPDTAPNAAFEPNGTTTGEASLVTPNIAIASSVAQVSFRHTYNTENNFDGGVLEVKIGAGAFTDIVTAGGSFVTGGYDDALVTDASCAGSPNPLSPRPSWNGASAYKTTIANLPAGAQGQNVQLRWRFGSDCSIAPAGGGWRVDTITVTDGFACCVAALNLIPTTLKVDERAAAGTTGNLDGVWSPGERVLVETGWTLFGPGPHDVTGTASNLVGPVGGTYTLNDSAANFGSTAVGEVTDCGSDCYQTSVDDPAVRPAHPWAATMDETVNGVPSLPSGTGFNKTWSLHIGDSFADAPAGSFAFRFIETIFKNGITGGCGGGNFCPNTNIPREQMAVFLLVSEEGTGYAPPPCVTPMFNDVPCSSGFAPWINELANPARAITAGCGGGNFCPADSVTRETMAVFLLRTEGGPTYNPPPCVTPVFGDVPCSSPFAPWINELNARGITGGCGGGNYCPATPVTRSQMSVFLTVTFGLVLYGP
jgi:hypothetical protein